MSGITFEFPDDVVRAIADAVTDRLRDELAAQQQDDGYLRAEQAAAILSAPKSRVYDLIAQGKLRVVYDGRTPLTTRRWIDAMLDGAS